MIEDPSRQGQALQRAERQLAFSRTTTGLLTSPTLSLEERLQQSLALLLAEIRARTGSIMLLSPDGKKLTVMAATRKEIVGHTQDIRPDSVSGLVCNSRAPLLVEDITKDHRFPHRSDKYKTNSFLSVPMLALDGVGLIGVINASDQESGQPFTQQDLETLVAYSAWIAPLIENSCLMSQVERERIRYKEIAEELELKQKELLINSAERSELVEMVVHDFKSPLSAIISNLDLLRFLGLKEGQEPIVQTAFEGGKKLLDMINDFLDVARLDHWQNERGQLLSLDLYPIIMDTADEVRPVALAKSVDIRVTEPRPLIVLGDPMLLQHLIQNLLTNAVKYTPEHGSIEIGWEILPSRRSGDLCSTVAKVYIQDTGIGVPAKLKRSIFEKFKRGNREADAKIQGTGIGLFICQRIVTMLKGRIWVEDNLPCGSRFCFTLFAPEGPITDCPVDTV